MNVKIEDFKTGFYGLSIALTKEELEKLVPAFEQLLTGEINHFHCSNTFTEKDGVADVQFCLQRPEVPDNMELNL